MKRKTRKLMLYAGICVMIWGGTNTVKAEKLNPIDKGPVYIEKGNQAIIRTNVTDGFARVTPKNSTEYKEYYKRIKVKSSNKKVATINKYGVVKAKKAGNAKVTISIGGKKKTHTWNVVVKKKMKPEEMFRYEIKKNARGSEYIEITGYKVNNAMVVVPAQINGVPVKVFSAQLWEDSYYYPANLVKEVYFQDGIMEIGDYALASIPSLQKVRLPKTLEKMGKGVFMNSGVKEVNMQAIYNLGMIPDNTFDGCTEFKQSLKISGNVTKIGICAFQNSGVKHVVLEEGVKEIKGWAFAFSGMKELSISSTVENIEDKAFAYIRFEKITSFAQKIENLSPQAFADSLVPIGSLQCIDGQLIFTPMNGISTWNGF